MFYRFSRRQYVADVWQNMVAEHMASVEREKFPELITPEMTSSESSFPDMTSSASSLPGTASSPDPEKCSDLLDVCDTDSGYSDS